MQFNLDSDYKYMYGVWPSDSVELWFEVVFHAVSNNISFSLFSFMPHCSFVLLGYQDSTPRYYLTLEEKLFGSIALKGPCVRMLFMKRISQRGTSFISKEWP